VFVTLESHRGGVVFTLREEPVQARLMECASGNRFVTYNQGISSILQEPNKIGDALHIRSFTCSPMRDARNRSVIPCGSGPSAIPGRTCVPLDAFVVLLFDLLCHVGGATYRVFARAYKSCGRQQRSFQDPLGPSRSLCVLG
jgi:hypothetical protein